MTMKIAKLIEGAGFHGKFRRVDDEKKPDLVGWL